MAQAKRNGHRPDPVSRSARPGPAGRAEDDRRSSPGPGRMLSKVARNVIGLGAERGKCWRDRGLLSVAEGGGCWCKVSLRGRFGSETGSLVVLLGLLYGGGLAYFFFLSGRWVSAEPAAVLEFFPVLPLFKTFEAAVPAFLPVCSLLAI